MTKATVVATLVTTFLVTGAVSARAQGVSGTESKGFLSVDFGAQPQQRTIETSSSFPQYDETATITTTQPVHNGPLFNVSGGYRFKPQLGVGMGFSLFNSRESESTVVASIPDLVFFSRPKTVTQTTTGLNHSEQAVHIQVLWFYQVTDEIEIVLSGGPSFFSVHQDLGTDVTVTSGTQNIVVAVEEEDANGVGFNGGFDGAYYFTPRFGAGLFLRYAGGNVDLPSVEGLAVGGFQTGLGVRVRF